MSRIVIDVSGDEHQKIKAMAALQGKSMKDYVMGKIFADNSDEDEAMAALETLLAGRIERAEQGTVSQKSFSQIARDMVAKADNH